MQNIFPLRQGGMTKMAGTAYVGSTPSNAAALLRPFIFSEEQRFAMEFSNLKIRLIFGGAYVSVVGAAATIGAWSDESSATSAGGAAPPDGGTGDINPVYDDWFVGGGGEFVLS
jgi:hypothetical protein